MLSLIFVPWDLKTTSQNLPSEDFILITHYRTREPMQLHDLSSECVCNFLHRERVLQRNKMPILTQVVHDQRMVSMPFDFKISSMKSMVISSQMWYRIGSNCSSSTGDRREYFNNCHVSQPCTCCRIRAFIRCQKKS